MNGNLYLNRNLDAAFGAKLLHGTMETHGKIFSKQRILTGDYPRYLLSEADSVKQWYAERAPKAEGTSTIGR